ncbi:MAG: integrase core domain-containing protein [Planctomycetota bacterium]
MKNRRSSFPSTCIRLLLPNFHRLRQQCLDTNWLLSLDDARDKTETWRQDCNECRPRGSLGHLASSGSPRRSQMAMTEARQVFS